MKPDFKKMAEDIFEKHGASGYGCCFEYSSVKRDCVSGIEAILRSMWEEAEKENAELRRKLEKAMNVLAALARDDFRPTVREAIRLAMAELESEEK